VRAAQLQVRRLVIVVGPLVGGHAAVSERSVVRARGRREREVLLHAERRERVGHALKRLLARVRLDPQVEEAAVVGRADLGLERARELGARLLARVLVGIEYLERDLVGRVRHAMPISG